MANKSFVRDAIGRFAKKAGRRVGKAAASQLDREVKDVEKKIADKLTQTKQRKAANAVEKAKADELTAKAQYDAAKTVVEEDGHTDTNVEDEFAKYQRWQRKALARARKEQVLKDLKEGK